jgi:5-methylcytosine-specific restriction endonuclease McrA
VIRCSRCLQLVPRYPCQLCRTDRRDKKVAKAVITRDGRCWKCGTTENLEAGHITPKALGGSDALSNQRAECRSLNRTGRCK